MPTHVELYDYYCRRSGCHPNSLVKKYLEHAAADRDDSKTTGNSSSALETLDVSMNYLGPRGLTPLLDLVKNTKTIRTLNLSHQPLLKDGVEHLAYCLALHPSVRQLILRDTNLQDDQVEILLQLLEMNDRILEVDIADNAELSKRSRSAVQAALQRNQIAQAQRQREEAAHETFLAEKAAAAATAKKSYSVSLTDSITAAESGGYVHFATWWKNPQYVVQTSRPTRVTFTLENVHAGDGPSAAAPATTSADQMGLVVLRHDGVHRALAISDAAPRTVVAESDVSEERCTVEAYLNTSHNNTRLQKNHHHQHKNPNFTGDDSNRKGNEMEAEGECGSASYVVMPYTFNPGRALQFRLTATLQNDYAGQEEGWVTMERLDSRYDWCVCAVEDGEWRRGVNAGGSGRHTTWRRNDMYHLTRTTPAARAGVTRTLDNALHSDGTLPLPQKELSLQQSQHVDKIMKNEGAAESTTHNISSAGCATTAAATTATLYVLLVKEADPYHNDLERAIGIDVVSADPQNPHAPPLFYTPDVVRAAQPHTAESFTLLKVELPLSELDVYVVPSTEVPDQVGTYTLTVFSSVEVQLTRSHFPHGWRYRALAGAWDEMCCGGCRAECPSWKNNPAWEVKLQDELPHHQHDPQQPARNEQQGQPLIACVELCRDAADAQDDAPASVPAAEQQDEDPDKMQVEESAEAAQRRAELAAFRLRHRSTNLEVGVMAVAVRPPAYPLLATSPQCVQAANVRVCAPASSLYVVPMLRHAAETAKYTLELFSPNSFLVVSPHGTSSPASTSGHNEGATQEGEKRAGDDLCLAIRERQAQLDAYASESAQRAALLQAAGQQAVVEGSPHDSPQLKSTRAAIFAEVAQRGAPFVDRDFPRGTSSLFLDPSAPAPFDFPAQTTWRRVSELAEEEVRTGAAGAATTRRTNNKEEEDQQVSVRAVNPATMPPPSADGPRHWFASVLQAVAAKPNWLRRIFVHYAREAGFAQFAFYEVDSWVGVTIDDYLLVDNQNELVYGRCGKPARQHTREPSDFFFPLAEKAYAKRHRCYEALEPKVNPRQSVLQLLCEGLMDVTGGVTTVTRIRSLTSREGVVMSPEERDALWRRLKRAIEPSQLCSFFLEKGLTDTRERVHVGVLPERLYGVVDARFVEQQRLIKLRLFDTSDANSDPEINNSNNNSSASTRCPSSGWKGQWCFSSPRWTPTLRDVLHYHEEEPYTVWVHFDEALYYFTHVFTTELSATQVSVAGNFAEAMTHEPETSTLSLRNPQFALTLTRSNDTSSATTAGTTTSPAVQQATSAGEEEDLVEVRVGLHRRDPRLDITREKGATAQFKTQLGFAVFATQDNTRRLAQVADDELLALAQPRSERDHFVTLRLDASYFATTNTSKSASTAAEKQITIMPFREHLRDPDVSYTISVRITSSNDLKNSTRESNNTMSAPQLKLMHVASNASTVVEGRWGVDGLRAGPPTFPQWRNNPQFFLSAKAATKVTITLRRRAATATSSRDDDKAAGVVDSAGSSLNDAVGFTLHRTKRCSSFLNYDPATVVASAVSSPHSGGGSSTSASCVVRLAGMAERRGMPYVLVPYAAAHDAGAFEIEVVSNQPIQLTPIDPRLDWHRVRYPVSINAAAGNTGGSPAYPSWRFNTQLALTFPVERDGRLFITARRVRSADPRVKLGLLLLRAEPAVAGSYRRRLTYDPSKGDVIAHSSDVNTSTGSEATSVSSAPLPTSFSEAVVDTEVCLPRDSGALILVVYADQPYKEAEVELMFYAASTVEVQPVQEWPAQCVHDGCWNLGTTAGGGRANFASWINNPFFGLTVLRPTKLVLLLVQYPRDHEHPVVRRHGAVKALLPPPLAHPDRCTTIQLSVARYDDALSEVAATRATTQAEIALTVELSPAVPYFVVPCTVAPQQDGDFKLFAFADYPIELYPTEKPRLPYV